MFFRTNYKKIMEFQDIPAQTDKKKSSTISHSITRRGLAQERNFNHLTRFMQKVEVGDLQ